MKGICELCGDESDKLEIMLYSDDKKYLCPKCWQHEADLGDMAGDAWLEQQKEEGLNE